MLEDVGRYKGLLFRELSARYGLGDMKEGGKDMSVWWKELVCIRSGVGLEVEGWFEENVWRDVGKGDNFYFFYGLVVRDLPLRDKFWRLFDLSENKRLTVPDMFTLGWGVVRRGSGIVGCWRGRRS